MMKRSQSLSINTIIIAAIGLLVLIVLIAIFSGRIQIFTKGARSCSSMGGECWNSCSTYVQDKKLPAGSVYTNTPGTDCQDKNQECCVPIIKNE